MQSNKQSFYWGKYRGIVLAVICFLILDITVLSLNFYISFLMSDSASAINLAGRQRMLSQRMTKELLAAELDLEKNKDIPTAVSLQALHTTVEQFNTTLNGFKTGGMVTSSNGQKVHLNAIQSATGRDILEQADAIWTPLYEQISQLNDQIIEAPDLSSATAYALANNVELLRLMNQLTSEMEAEANARADFLRWVQTIGIILALLNFGYILGKSLNRLRESDREIEQAQQETLEILGTVKEGLFLLGQDFRIGSQYSTSLAKILGRPIEAGGNFKEILRDMVEPNIFKSACEYIKLLLGDRVKESLVQDLNPLNQIEVMIPNSQGKVERRYLTLQFSRALQEGQVSHLLVTVFDVTTQVELGQALVDARKKAKADVEVMLDLLKVHPTTLKNYLDSAEIALLNINDQLRDVVGEKDYQRTFAQIFRQIHSLKGEAAALGLEVFEETAQQFESMLSGLRNKGAVLGSDLLTLPLPLDEFLKRITAVREISQRLASYQTSFQNEHNEMHLATSMSALAQRIARDQGKQVKLATELTEMNKLPTPVRSALNDIALQLLRNAVVHGIEDQTKRSTLSKAPVGSVYVSLKQIGEEFEFIVRDDGRGLNPELIRQELLRRGNYSEAQLNEMNEQQIIQKIFDAGFSTVTSANRDAGQGVGMDVVKHKIQELGAHLRISTRKDGFTQFTIRFSPNQVDLTSKAIASRITEETL